MTNKFKLLESVLAPAVDGGCSNAYEIVRYAIKTKPLEARLTHFTLNDLEKVLSSLSKKWEKEIIKATE